MNAIAKLGILTAWWLTGTIKKTLTTQNIVKEAKEYAARVQKPILNIGCGKTDFGDVNADVKYQNVKNFMLIDANKPLPFTDKEFAVCICAHLIEHLDNPEFSLSEMYRIADKIYCSFPEWWQLGTYLTPDHKWFVIKDTNAEYGIKFIPYTSLPAIGASIWWILM